MDSIASTAASLHKLNIAVAGSTGSGVSAIASFLAKNYASTQQQPLTQDEINLALDHHGLVRMGISKTQTFIDKEAVLIVVDSSQKQLDKVFYSKLLAAVATYRLTPIFFFNKLDLVIFSDSVKSTENVYQILVDKIDELNGVIEEINAANEQYGVQQLNEIDPVRSNVFFGSAVDGWAFNLLRFAGDYAKKLKTDQVKMVAKLWGENFYDESAKKWVTSKSEGKNVQQQRSFCSLVLEPIWNIYHLTRQGYIENVLKLIQALDIKVDTQDKKGRLLLRMTMFAWMNSAEALVKGAFNCVPSFAQGIRETRADVFSVALKEEAKGLTEGSVILQVYSEDESNRKNAAVTVKVLKKAVGKSINDSTFYGFESDVIRGNRITFEKVSLAGKLRVHLQEDDIDWDKVCEGDVIDLLDGVEGAVVFTSGLIITDSLKVAQTAHFRNYVNGVQVKSVKVEQKAPMTVGNAIMGLVDKNAAKVSDVLRRRNELFATGEELKVFLKEKMEFGQKDVDAIIAIEGDSLVLNYTKDAVNDAAGTSRKHDAILGRAFSNAIQILKVSGARVEINSVNIIDGDDDLKTLEKDILQELKSIVQA